MQSIVRRAALSVRIPGSNLDLTPRIGLDYIRSIPLDMASSPRSAQSLTDLLRELGTKEWMLVRLRDQLYGGLWGEMRTDLECRRRGEPYIFKLVNRIEEDLERIARLEAIEGQWGVDLGKHLPGAA